jgi:hypothetical protein
MKKHYVNYCCFLITCLFIVYTNKIYAQPIYFFTEGTSSSFYDQGIVDIANLGNSTFEHTNPPGFPQYNDKVPCVGTAYQGNTSLKFNYFSSATGNWKVTIYRSDWSIADISDKDSIILYVYSPSEIPSTALPKIGLRCVNASATGDASSQLYHLASYNQTIPASKWTKVKFPLSVIKNDPLNSSIDLKKVKGVIFNQSETDNSSRMLYIDVIAAFKNIGPIPDIPYFAARGHDCHAELTWRCPLNGLSYRVYASFNAGQTFELRGETTDSSYIDFVPESARNSTINYRIVAFALDNESKPSETTATLKNHSDEQLMDMFQQYCFRYFWEGAHQASGMALERTNGGKTTVASGATGMGLMAMIVAYQREYRNREEIKDRILKILNFLETCDRFHGAWSHWYNADTKKTQPFSTKDDGGDLVETSYVAMALIALRNYFSGQDDKSVQIRQKSTLLWQGIEWDWYRKGGMNVLYWHWSPNYNFEMNMPIKGWNEALITYIMAAASPTYTIPKTVYDSGWASGGNMVNKRTFYNYPISLSPDYGGPLFWIQYSFLGIDPRGLSDQYANYWNEATNTARIHYAYAIFNPNNHKNYSNKCWGLTASDDPGGYRSHEPMFNDNGTISPTAALASMPFTPEESMRAMRYFYQERGKDLFGIYGPYDAFNDNLGWVQKAYIGIDQGPIVIMTENHRTGLLWNNVMKDTDIQAGLLKLGFKNGPNTSVRDVEANSLKIYPNPAKQILEIEGEFLNQEKVFLFEIHSVNGKIILSTKIECIGPSVTINLPKLPGGIYFIRLTGKKTSHSGKIVISH